MNINIRPATREERDDFAESIDQWNWDFYWSVEVRGDRGICLKDEGTARNHKHALKLAQRAGQRLLEFRYITIKDCGGSND